MTHSPKYADLHLHTVFSDGTYTPEELISASAKRKLSAIAVVDHDTIRGIEPVMQAARLKNIEVIPGIELSAEYEGAEIHILGYFIDCKNTKLTERLNILKQTRIERVYKIVEKLKDMGVALDPDKVFDFSGQGTVGRLHIARAMVLEGKVSSVFEAFKKYIGDKCSAYVLGFKFSPCEAIKLIKEAGGIPVLAHPYTIHNDELIIKFIGEGLMGLEVYYPEHSQSMVNFYKNLAIQHNLLITGGSDCHGSAKGDMRIGSIKVSYELVEKMKAAKTRS